MAETTLRYRSSERSRAPLVRCETVTSRMTAATNSPLRVRMGLSVISTGNSAPSRRIAVSRVCSAMPRVRAPIPVRP